MRQSTRAAAICATILAGALSFPNSALSTPITGNGYTFTGLSVPGAGNARATGLSSDGRVVGTWDVGGFGPTTQSFYWTPNGPNAPTGTMQDLGNFNFSLFRASGVNSSGQISATGSNFDQFGNPFDTPFVLQGNTLTRLETGIIPGGCHPFTGCTNPGFMNGHALAINESGQVAGDFGFQGSSAAFWGNPAAGITGSNFTKVIDQSQGFAQARAVNNNGHVTGNSNGFPAPNNTPFGLAYLWDGSSATALGTPPMPDGSQGNVSTGYGINDLDQVVGSWGGVNRFENAFVYMNGVMVDLGPGIAYDINNKGQAVGTSGGHAVLWDVVLGTKLDLNTVMPADSGWVLTEAVAINELGQIAGNGLFNGGSGFIDPPFLLTPAQIELPPVNGVPEPAQGMLLALGLALLVLMRRYKT